MTKRNRWLAIIIALCTICLLMTGCAESDEGNHESRDIVENERTEGEKTSDEPSGDVPHVPGLVFIESYKIEANGRNFYQMIFYDPETLILYSYVEWVDGGGFIEMHNDDGSPRLYTK